MCIVHRIIKDSQTGRQAAIRFEFAPKKGITLSTREIKSGAFSIGVTTLDADASTTVRLSKKPIRQNRREPFTERARRLENARLTGTTLELPCVDECHLSPQSNCGINSIIRKDVESLGRRRTSRRTCDRNPINGAHHVERDSHGFHGRKPHNKHHRNHAVAW